jgi:tetratricopeptide (TPR) repeat protein
MALALVMTGQVDEAINHFQEALQINPGFAEAHNELGRLLAIQGKREEAINHFREALWIKPNFTIAQKNLEMALKAGKGTK